MTALDDFEDGPPALQPPERSYPETGPTLPPPAAFAGPEERTNPGVPRPTLQMPAAKVEELNAEMVKHEGGRVAEWLGTLDQKLTSIDAGVKAALAASERAEIAAERTRADVHKWLFGDDSRPGIAAGLDATNKLAKDALDLAHQAKRLAITTYDGVFNGPESVSAEDREACEVARRSHRPTG